MSLLLIESFRGGSVHSLKCNAIGIGTAAGDLRRFLGFGGVTVGSGYGSAGFAVLRYLAESATSTSSGIATIRTSRPLAGQIAGLAQVTGTIFLLRSLAGIADGFSTLLGVLVTHVGASIERSWSIRSEVRMICVPMDNRLFTISQESRQRFIDSESRYVVVPVEKRGTDA
mgnify:FL=1